VARSYVREARRRGVGRRRERIGLILDRLSAEHADAAIALRFRTDLELLVSVVLSAQTTDANVNRVTPALFAKYRRAADYLAVSQEELERDIYATGFFRQKAKSIRGAMRMRPRTYSLAPFQARKSIRSSETACARILKRSPGRSGVENLA